MSTFDDHGLVEPGSIFIQIKARDALTEKGSNFVYDLDVRDYNLWMNEKLPVIFIMFDASNRRAYWLAVQNFFAEAPTRRPKKGAKHVRIELSKRRVVNRKAIAKMRELKWAMILQDHG